MIIARMKMNYWASSGLKYKFWVGKTLSKIPGAVIVSEGIDDYNDIPLKPIQPQRNV